METKSLKSKVKLAAVILLLFISFGANAQKEKIQTAFVYQLTRLVEWCPEGKQGNFVIGVVGGDAALLAEILTLQVRRVGAQQIEIKTFKTASEITNSNILFVPDSQFDNITQIQAKVSGFCTLVVSDRVGSANKGAGVSLVYNTRQEKVEFEINRDYMKSKSLNVNNQLYNLASRVY